MRPRFIALCLLLSLVGFQAKAESSAAKLALASTVVREAGFERQILGYVPATVAAWKKARPDVPSEFWEQQGRAYGRRQVDMHIALYAKQCTEAELQEMIDFYASPLGRRFFEIGERMSPLMLQGLARTSAEFQTELAVALRQGGFKVTP